MRLPLLLLLAAEAELARPSGSTYAGFWMLFVCCGCLGAIGLFTARSVHPTVRPWVRGWASVIILGQWGGLVAESLKYPGRFAWWDGPMWVFDALVDGGNWSSPTRLLMLVVPSLGILATTFCVPLAWRRSRARDVAARNPA